MGENFTHLNGLNAYEVLGIEPTCTTDEIEAAYRAAIKRQHSDLGGATRLAQLVNDARDALINHRVAYDAWLDQDRVRASGTRRAADPTSAAAHSSDTSSVDSEDHAEEDYAEDGLREQARDPWKTAPGPHATQWPSGSGNQPGAAGSPWRPSETWLHHEPPINTPPYGLNEPTAERYLADVPPIHQYVSAPPLAEVRRASREAARLSAPLTSGLLALLASFFCGPIGLWLGIRSCRSSRGPSISAILAILIGGVTTLFFVLGAVEQYL